MVDRGDLGGGLAVLGSMVGAALTWAAGIGVGTILFSVGLGAFLTYFVTIRTQKGAWKREVELRKVDEIYGPVYFELNKIHQALSQNKGSLYYGSIDQTEVTWESIQSGYKYYLVDPRLRSELDGFFSLLTEYRPSYSQRYEVVSELLLPRLRKAFGEDVQAISYQIAGTTSDGRPAVGGGGTLDEPILAGESPLGMSAKVYPSIKNPHIEFSIQRTGTMQFAYGQSAGLNPAVLDKFNEVLKSTTEAVLKDPRIVLASERRKSLLSQVLPLKEKLRAKTEEAWGIIPSGSRT